MERCAHFERISPDVQFFPVEAGDRDVHATVQTVQRESERLERRPGESDGIGIFGSKQHKACLSRIYIYIYPRNLCCSRLLPAQRSTNQSQKPMCVMGCLNDSECLVIVHPPIRNCDHGTSVQFEQNGEGVIFGHSILKEY